uniref:HVA22-like protein n=1 Tax=Aegilops tauschii subsp. strangulata TaxID=200361 RepID=A0A453N0H0_AEGTS
ANPSFEFPPSPPPRLPRRRPGPGRRPPPSLPPGTFWKLPHLPPLLRREPASQPPPRATTSHCRPVACSGRKGVKMVVGSFITRALILVLGYAYPAYDCYKTVELNRPEIEQLRFWCQYWILLAMLTVFERVGDNFISW